MTVFETIKDYDEDMMAEFLLRFANDVINQFANFVFPTKEGITEFLNREKPE